MRNRWPILALLCLLASLLVPGIASASTAPGAETRVWAFDLADQARVGVERSLTLELHRECDPSHDQLASDSLLAARGGKGLTTPGKFFGDKTAKEASEALGKKFGPPRSTRPGAETFYNPKTGRSYNVHTDPAHGPPHVDIRTRGPIPDRQVPLGGGN
jgi:hypothetical protein